MSGAVTVTDQLTTNEVITSSNQLTVLPNTNTFITEKANEIEIVIARYSENISWAFKNQFSRHKKTIYNKSTESVLLQSSIQPQSSPYSSSPTTSSSSSPTTSSSSSPKLILTHSSSDVVQIFLPNVGRESHSFLYHIVENYDRLADMTIFLPGSAMDLIKESKTLDILEKTITSKQSMFSGMWYQNIRNKFYDFEMQTWIGTSTNNQKAMPSTICAPASIRPFGRWYDYYFQDIVTHVVCYTSTFSVSREDIHHRSKEFYIELLNTLSTHSNPEVGHFMERAWLAIFHPVKDACQYFPRYENNLPYPTNNNKANSSSNAQRIQNLVLKRKSFSELLQTLQKKSSTTDSVPAITNNNNQPKEAIRDNGDEDNYGDERTVKKRRY